VTFLNKFYWVFIRAEHNLGDKGSGVQGFFATGNKLLRKQIISVWGKDQLLTPPFLCSLVDDMKETSMQYACMM